MSIEDKLKAAGITLPAAPAPVANYVPCVEAGGLLFVSGQVASGPDGVIKGKLGADMGVEAGAQAARACGLSLLAQAQKALGSLDRVAGVVRLTGFVNSTPDFTDQPKVVNGASDLMVAVFGDAGRHSRAAVSAPSLPMGAAVEVDAIFAIRD